MTKYKWTWDWRSILPVVSLITGFHHMGKNFKNDGFQFRDLLGWYGFQQGDRKEDLADSVASNEQVSQILGEVQSNERQQYLEDRTHTEQREDSAYQRGVEDMRKAGLSPYTIGASPSASSVSTVGQNSVASKLQLLGYMLDIKNLDIKNKSLINNIIGNAIKLVA